MPIVGLIAQGEMGCGVGGRLVERGVSVLTVLEGRSAASEKRALDAGMQPASWSEVADVDLFISLVPPAEALPLATKLAPYISAAKRKVLYADLNAINPRTAETVADVVTRVGATFADGGVCGAAPAPGKPSPAIYTSGPGAIEFGSYSQYGLDIRVMDAPIGAASAVKICQASMTKGYTALASIAVLAAMRFGAGETLRREIETQRSGLFEFLQPATLRMFPKAYRFVGEMEEISDFMEAEAGGSDVFAALGDFYRHMAADLTDGKEDVDLLTKFYS